MTKEPATSIASTTFDFDPDIIFWDDQENFQEFVFIPFTINLNRDDDEALMTKGQFK